MGAFGAFACQPFHAGMENMKLQRKNNPETWKVQSKYQRQLDRVKIELVHLQLDTVDIDELNGLVWDTFSQVNTQFTAWEMDNKGEMVYLSQL